jgi:hypothetical protein
LLVKVLGFFLCTCALLKQRIEPTEVESRWQQGNELLREITQSFHGEK